jgi:molybdopterin biosynthesis enzyme
MDGIAVRASDTAGASGCAPVVIPAGVYEVVDTGDPLPEDFDAVVMREHVRFALDDAWLGSEVAPHQNVRSIGEDVVSNELLLLEGHRLRPVDVATCGAAGVTDVLVRRKPMVAVLPTGDKMRPIGADITRGQFHDTNSLMFASQAEEIGCEAIVLPIEPDDPEAISRRPEGRHRLRPVDHHRGRERGSRRLHGGGDRAARRARRARRGGRPPGTRLCSGRSTPHRCWGRQVIPYRPLSALSASPHR